MIDVLVFNQMRSRLNNERGQRRQLITSLEHDGSGVHQLLALDPTPTKRYLKWILNRLSIDWLNELIGDPEQAVSFKHSLLEFDAVKCSLPAEQRDIFGYKSLSDVDDLLVPMRATRYRARRQLVNDLELEDVLDQTLVLAQCGVTVHCPRHVEDAIVLTGSERAYCERGQGLYSRMAQLGRVLIFNTHAGVLIGYLPNESEQRGHVFDFLGEPAILDDVLLVHRDLSWHSAPELLSMMIQIDPTLPFDAQMTELEPYVIALTRFPWVLLEDRELPPELEEQLRQHPVVGPAILSIEAQ